VTPRSARGFDAWWILAGLLALIAVFALINPRAFLSLYNVQNVIGDAAALLILATGMTFVIATAGIDLSVGAILLFAEIVAAQVMIALGGAGWGVALIGALVSVLVGAAWGLLNGAMVAYLRIPALIATLGTLGMAGGGALLLTEGANIRTGIPAELTQHIGGALVFGVVPAVAVIALAVVLVAWAALAHTRFGLHVLGAGSNARALARTGVAVEPIYLKVYALSGACAGLAGVIDLARFSTTTIGGHATDNLQAVTAVVIGGTSLFGGVASIVGTVIDVFIPAVMNNGLIIAGVPSFWQQVTVGAVLVLAVYIDQLRRR
jgi:ribose transport system permease protein